MHALCTGMSVLPTTVREIDMLSVRHFREPLDLCHLRVCWLWKVRVTVSLVHDTVLKILRTTGLFSGSAMFFFYVILAPSSRVTT